ncbi:hypothetical protein FHS29_006380 [Saccharothrix tamanrassetensis]|uniref:Uncharacterized protein n=1 Tax=Saccharothrix tamanrassetensis TaxID=1051531 RepID=A0A841CR37_9PSEU|nr:hypothetical protein [Saccharothrix tamanrassetensis]MBB5959759.1 hypothetical protein [Saccharothrix tamanrassetensis]
MCLYLVPGLAAALAWDSAGPTAATPADRRPGVADTAPPATGEHLVGATNQDQAPHTTSTEENPR